MQKCKCWWHVFCLCGSMLMILGSALSASAQSSCPVWVGKLVSLQGSVEVRRSGRTDWQAAALEDTFCFGDTIRVLENGRAAVQLQNDALLRIDQETTLTFSKIENDRTYVIDLLKGAAHFFSRGSRSLKVVTPYVNAAVEGTEFEVRVTDEDAKVTLLQGKVLLDNAQGQVTLAKGQEGIARAGSAPTSHVTVNPRDAVKWALYYPRVVQAPSEKAASISDVRRLVLQAEEKLSLGQVDGAEEDIESALFLEPESGGAISLKAIIAVVNNHKEEAETLARKAVEVSPGAASARIALSYARQAAFDLEGALSALEKAVELEPENALAWSRLSELRLSLEDVSGAFDAAKRAAAINPKLPHTQTVLGYAYLEQGKIKAAVKAFEAAISLDSSAPLPQLGLGLARIRQGKLAEGRRLLELAAGLDPANSVFRSYLGKAYFEEKRDSFSAKQFEMAKELDPLDPTPWLYDAIRKQSTNRPVEALYDLQESIKLNDNRAVYRSRFQLDQDLAVRGTSLARVYNDLGFQQLGIFEGQKSLSIDPGNYSAHQLLADSYSALPRHEIARVSELLQAELLQPVNTMPIPANLAKTDLTLMESSLLGSTQLPTDFSMMTQNGIHLHVTGLAGSNALAGGDLTVSGVSNRFSFSTSYNYFSTDGFRDNDDQTGRLTDAFAQVQLTSKTSLQAEYRNKDAENGDLRRLFDPSYYWPNQRDDNTGDLYRVGLHHQFAPGADFLFSGIYQKINSVNTNYYYPMNGYNIDVGYEYQLLEVQQQVRFKNLTAVAGGGYFKDSGDTLETLQSPLFPMPVSLDSPVDKNQTNIYLYTYSSFPRGVTVTLGVDYSQYDDGQTDGEQWSPKFGIVWQLSGATTLHAAAFRTLRRLLTDDTPQTIEPTQVAFFNQFFDDPAGTDTWHYGIGLDHNFSQALYGGLEYFQRDIAFPFLMVSMSSEGVPVSVESTADWTNKTARGYLYWTPDARLSTALEVYYEHLDRGTSMMSNPTELSHADTWRIPLSVHYFNPNGIIAGVKETYVRQEGEFGYLENGVPYEPGSDAFWVTDALVGYRLPKRLGTVTLEVRNLFDARFSFQDTDPANPETVPERVVLGRVSLSF